MLRSLKYMVVSGDQNSGQNHTIKTNNKSFERVEHFRYLGTTLTNQNSIQEEIKSKLKPGNACYYSVQNLLSSILLSKIGKMYYIRNYNFAHCFVWVWSLVADIDGGTLDEDLRE